MQRPVPTWTPRYDRELARIRANSPRVKETKRRGVVRDTSKCHIVVEDDSNIEARLNDAPMRAHLHAQLDASLSASEIVARVVSMVENATFGGGFAIYTDGHVWPDLENALAEHFDYDTKLGHYRSARAPQTLWYIVLHTSSFDAKTLRTHGISTSGVALHLYVRFS